MRSLRLPILCLLVATALGSPSPASAALKAPPIQKPGDDAQVEAIPSFTWASVRGADRYEFQLSADANFGSIVGGRGKGSFQTRNTAATVTGSHPDGTYWWRVRAITAKGKAGSWSKARTIRKVWSTAPQLISPVDATAVVFPAAPLVLRWTSVPRTYKYRVLIATDPDLGSLVFPNKEGAIETSGTVFSPGQSLPPGKYYWGVQPVDSAGHRGTRSPVGSFVWSWPTAATTGYMDLIDDPRVADPRVSWSSVPGAVAYEVEINRSEDFAVGSRVCLQPTGPVDPPCPLYLTTGTSMSPLRVIPNNVYHWRVRALDADGNSGQWNRGNQFDKNFFNHAFSDADPTIQNLRVADNLSPTQATDLDPNTSVLDTSAPVIRWDPLPGAATYVIRVYGTSGDNCNLGEILREAETAATAWTPVTTAGADPPVPIPQSVGVTAEAALAYGASYCVTVFAVTGNKAVISNLTQLGGTNKRAFRYQPPADTPPGPEFRMAASDYVAPVGTLVPRVPVLTWNRIPGAGSYWVYVARDAGFSNIVDVAVTNVPAYAPRANRLPRGYRDEDTPYYWVVIPALGTAGDDYSTLPANNSPRSFDKRSVPPVLLTPTAGAEVTEQPAFRWASGDPSIGAPEGAKSYRLQVAVDPSFGELVDDVTTQATSYTAEDVYPADTVLHWRVRVNTVPADGRSDVGLSWSSVGTFRRRLEAPVLSAGNGITGSIIPALTWSPVQGALSYDVHVDQADGTRKDFNLRGTAFTPVTWYGTGVWRWQVRANFPNGSKQVPSAYTPVQSFARRIPAPDGARAERSTSRTLLSWEPVFNAKEYRVEFSETNSFSRVGQTITTQNLAAAPNLSMAPFANGGQIFWRVAARDEGNNVGGYAAGAFRTARRMIISKKGALARGKTATLVIKLVDSDGDAIRKVRVGVSGVARARAKRTGRRGTATFRLRPRRRGTVVFRATRAGYQPAEARVVVP